MREFPSRQCGAQHAWAKMAPDFQVCTKQEVYQGKALYLAATSETYAEDGFQLVDA